MFFYLMEKFEVRKYFWNASLLISSLTMKISPMSLKKTHLSNKTLKIQIRLERGNIKNIFSKIFSKIQKSREETFSTRNVVFSKDDLLQCSVSRRNLFTENTYIYVYLYN